MKKWTGLSFTECTVKARDITIWTITVASLPWGRGHKMMMMMTTGTAITTSHITWHYKSAQLHQNVSAAVSQ